jgi:Asp-tRNA(Asn)/Glu-tRNA(Gln) amidotransferase A subunit family amidase
VSPEYFLNGLDPEVERVTLDALRRLSMAGTTLVWAEIPDIAKEARHILGTISNYDGRTIIGSFLEQQGTGLSEDFQVELRGEKKRLIETMAPNEALGSCASMASLVLPAGLTADGLPVGIEFAALNGKDRELLALGLRWKSRWGR